MKKHLAYFLLATVMLAACCKEKENEPDTTYPDVPCYEKFLGSYHVTDLQTLEEYSMTISHFASINEFGVEVDTIVMNNFDQRFDVRFGFGCYANPSQNHLGWGFHFGQADYSDFHWALYYDGADTLNGIQMNTLIGDTIYFLFDKSNIAFYLEEGVPYEACENCILKAVKQCV